jgi:hypothetical protein
MMLMLYVMLAKKSLVSQYTTIDYLRNYGKSKCSDKSIGITGIVGASLFGQALRQSVMYGRITLSI